MTPRQRRFLLIAALSLLLGLGCIYLFQTYLQQPPVVALDDARARKIRELHKQLEQNNAQSQARQVELFPFNPNLCDSMTFIRLGLLPWQAHNALQYRRKGGIWCSPEHFSKLYGLTDSAFQRLAPYIQIPQEISVSRSPGSFQRDSTSFERYPTKMSEGQTLSVNSADTTALKSIPGIGSYYANKIVAYRESLGGFHSVSQLHEIKNLPEDIDRWVVIDQPVVLRKTNVNKATFQQLVRHPYLNYDQVKAIFEYRRLYGSLTSWKDVMLSGCFTEKEIRERLNYYFEF